MTPEDYEIIGERGDLIKVRILRKCKGHIATYEVGDITFIRPENHQEERKEKIKEKKSRKKEIQIIKSKGRSTNELLEIIKGK